MPSAEDIAQRIEASIPGAAADVEDYTGTGDHFRATVTAAAFAGRSRIEQHRLVYEIFGAEIGGPIHALSLKTQVPADASAERTAAPERPSPNEPGAHHVEHAPHHRATDVPRPTGRERRARLPG
jgi:stress-induced morphogen